MPAACGEAAEERTARRLVVQMEWLRIELCGEGLDGGRVDTKRCRDELLSRGEVFEIDHGDSPRCTAMA